MRPCTATSQGSEWKLTDEQLKRIYTRDIQCESDRQAAAETIESLNRIIRTLNSKITAYTSKEQANDTKLKQAYEELAAAKVEKTKLECPEVKFRLFAGMEAGNNTSLTQFTAKANIGFQNAKGWVFRGGYDTADVIWIGVDFPLITIKR